MNLRKIISSYLSWRAKRRLYRAQPMFIELDAKEKELRRQHRKVRGVQAEKKACMMAMLRRGM